MTKLLSNARVRLKQYDADPNARRYNPAAMRAYRLLATGGMPRNRSAWLALGEALIAFDMGRQLERLESPKGRDHLCRLRRALARCAPLLRSLLSARISPPFVRSHITTLIRLFDQLSGSGRVVPGERFVVGATKALHFLNPELFLIVDKNVAEKLHQHTPLLPKSATNYRGFDYVVALKIVASATRAYGVARLRNLQAGQPALRIVDKILFK